MKKGNALLLAMAVMMALILATSVIAVRIYSGNGNVGQSESK